MQQNAHTLSANRRQPKLALAAETLSRLEGLAEGALRRTPELAERLLGEIGRAKVVSTAKLRPDVVAIGRSVTYRDDLSGLEKTVRLVFPEDADITQGLVSVMTPIGVALIGLATGASMRWETTDGQTRQLTVVKVSDAGSNDPQTA